ncbi:pimelyl-ACP methyl ester esterase BioV [Aliarcobacter cryaerophilus]|nr:pimelyl-ACP methyl ester esterase BioV [Aliarcobacter cryaerophilus]
MICNNFYSGFCFKNECELFKDYLEIGDFIISGFSYGAIRAFKQALESQTRVDKLQLFSPSFFQNKDEKFKKMQKLFFKKDEKSYINNFLENVKYPQNKDIKEYLHIGKYEELEELLEFVWKKEDFEKLISKRIKIEVFLGEKDKIIDSFFVKEFFKDFATVYYFKDKGHLL